MKNIEIIKLILEEKPDENIYTLFKNEKIYNLIYLCTLNNKYLDDNVLNQVLSDKESDDYYSNIAFLLSNFPDLIKKIPNDILNNLNNDWTTVISKQPQLFDKCKIIHKFDAYTLRIIFKDQPELVSKYKNFYYKDKHENTLFSFILNYKEDLNVDFDNIFMTELNKNINEITVFTWLYILSYNPDLIKICPKVDEINNLNIIQQDQVISLVSKQIQFKYLLPHIDDITNDNLAILISEQPQLIEELNVDLKKLDKDNWVEILKKQPQLIDKYDKLENFNSYDWVYIVSRQPKLIEYCNKINEFDSYSWYLVLSEQPELIKYCANLDKISAKSWNMILQCQPSLADKCNKFDEFVGNDLYDLLEKQPNLIDKCKDTKIINRNKQIRLMKKYPNVINKMHLKSINKKNIEILYNSKEHCVEYMKSYIKKNNDSKVLTDMISIYPKLKDIYTKNNLWRYVVFNELTDNLEYAMLK